MRSLLVIRVQPTLSASIDAIPLTPEKLLGANGYHVQVTDSETEALKLAGGADASILHLSLADMEYWVQSLGKGKSDTPLLWWCAPDTASSSAESCEVETSFDGILTPSMSGPEIHWTLHFAAKRYMERKQWEQERKQLQSRLEDRKWIDMAKAILCDLKQISESEAYDLLRKKAMDERKRMVDVATAIVKAHQLLQS
ncbi:ANTAR domain-containing protein [Paenibacillus sp. JNUCC31]|uniref:ANTAR domain-containing response regulator n=1 Tax=unclassified Paenibacillus TaxID=185978 RepID=UPI00177ECD5E|nr:ANTAR domain-containing protein [Paenibacillus sp. JNUCC-31]QOS81725.1 ANTAR domain-containing protein [Paenibacillus sp. JNUCC-31]